MPLHRLLFYAAPIDVKAPIIRSPVQHSARNTYTQISCRLGARLASAHPRRVLSFNEWSSSYDQQSRHIDVLKRPQGSGGLHLSEVETACKIPQMLARWHDADHVNTYISFLNHH